MGVVALGFIYGIGKIRVCWGERRRLRGGIARR
jgi:hypothetical protein